jgi:hypothetical protein
VPPPHLRLRPKDQTQRKEATPQGAHTLTWSKTIRPDRSSQELFREVARLLHPNESVCSMVKTNLGQSIDIRQRKHNQETSFHCRICWANTSEVILSPCNHIGLCMGCMQKYVQVCSQSGSMPCPFCRKEVERFNRVYLP